MDSYRPRSDTRYPASNGDSYRPSRHDDRTRESQWSSRSADSNNMFYFKAGGDRGAHDDYDRDPRSRYTRGRNDYKTRDRNRRVPGVHFGFKVSERPLLRMEHGAEDDPSLLQNGTGAKFRAIDDLTDSEEEEMAESEDEDQGRTKRPRTGTPVDDEVALPKWSNPDPYTSLPPVQSGETAAKRTDVLRLIRKARLESDSATNLNATPDDFISFDMDDQNSETSSELEVLTSRPYAVNRRPDFDTGHDAGARHRLGKRKRGETSEDEGQLRPHRRQQYTDRWVSPQWIAAEGEVSAPWFVPHDRTVMPGVALHNEIVHFHEWIKPRQFEERVRAEVFDRLSRELRNCMAGELKAFGSYAAGLYLPTGDMDLVFLTRKYRPNVIPDKTDVRSPLHNIARYLREERIAIPGSVIVIGRAKVPIVKFVDRMSGLKIDLCINNDSGVMANETFQGWKRDYPFMPVLVSIIKQFLMIRGLNDVATGGLGGFSTICLVTSLMQLWPRQMSATDPAPNLGQLLLEFFKLYGNFDRDSIAIRLNPPGYVDKAGSVAGSFGDKTGRLVIIDPNRPDNNISGGTGSIQRILHAFRLAHDGLLQRLDEFENLGSDAQPESFLDCIVGGNFDAYERQRQMLYDLYDAKAYVRQATSSVFHPLPPPPPPPADTKGAPLPPPPPPPPPDHKVNGKPSSANEKTAAASNSKANSDDQVEPASKVPKSQRRAIRLKRLRPDLEPSIGNTISQMDALKLGGYRSPEEMQKDLEAREQAARKLASSKKK